MKGNHQCLLLSQMLKDSDRVRDSDRISLRDYMKQKEVPDVIH